MQEKRTIGWREWLGLPELGIERIKAKVDTGARSSCLHAFDLELDEDGLAPVIHFSVHTIQRNAKTVVRCSALLHEYRVVRSSNGQRERRPIIHTTVRLCGASWPIDLTLSSRDQMGFRMLLGRQAIRRAFLVDPGRSYRCRELAPPPRRKKKVTTP